MNDVIVNKSFTAFLGSAWRLWLLLVWAAWWGGLCFYAVVVVPIGTRVVGGVEQGFVTQAVTQVHNALSGLFLVCLLIEAGRRRSRALWTISAMLAVIDVALVTRHASLTGMMDFQHQTVPGGFYGEHAVYLWITAVEWAMGLAVPVWLIILGDRAVQNSSDKGTQRRVPASS